jgi:hypothetical protein
MTNTVGTKDTNPHPSVQAWSKGDIFPAVISTVEKYTTAMSFDEWKAGNTQIARSDVAPILYANYLEAFYSQPLEARRVWTAFRLLHTGFDELYATYEDALMVAKAMLAGIDDRLGTALMLRDRAMTHDGMGVI